jgi:hypothetical protein
MSSAAVSLDAMQKRSLDAMQKRLLVGTIKPPSYSGQERGTQQHAVRTPLPILGRAQEGGDRARSVAAVSRPGRASAAAGSAQATSGFTATEDSDWTEALAAVPATRQIVQVETPVSPCECEWAEATP